MVSSFIVVASGYLTGPGSEILSLEDNTWGYGPDLPYDIMDGASVQMEDTFLIVGGYTGSTFLNTIWKFNTLTEDWTLHEQNLTIARDATAAFLVPDYFC